MISTRKKCTRIKGLRAEKERNQEEMANLLGITKQAYNNKENGRTQFTLSEAKKLSIFFGLSIEEIFFDSKVTK